MEGQEGFSDSYEIKKGLYYPKRFLGIKIYCTFELSDKERDDFENSKIPAMKNLITHLEEEFGDVTKFVLILTKGDEPRYSIKGNQVYINYDKWIEFFNSIRDYTEDFRISRIYKSLASESRRQGIIKYFTDKDVKEIFDYLDNSVYRVIEDFLLQFDELDKSEREDIVRTIEDSKVGTILANKYRKLDEGSYKLQLKGVLTNIKKLKKSELLDLLNTLYRAKIESIDSKVVGKLPLEHQTRLLDTISKKAKLYSMYQGLKKSLKEFEKIINTRKNEDTKNEKSIHAFLAENYWLLGIEYFGQVIKTDINKEMKKTGDTYHSDWRIYPDFEIQKIDGTKDVCVVIELEAVNDKIFNKDGFLSKQALDGLFQSITYTIYHRVNKNLPTKGIAVLGSIGKKNANQIMRFNRLSEMFPNIEILTYEDLLEKGKKVIEFLDKYEKGKLLNNKKDEI